MHFQIPPNCEIVICSKAPPMFWTKSFFIRDDHGWQIPSQNRVACAATPRPWLIRTQLSLFKNQAFPNIRKKASFLCPFSRFGLPGDGCEWGAWSCRVLLDRARRALSNNTTHAPAPVHDHPQAARKPKDRHNKNLILMSPLGPPSPHQMCYCSQTLIQVWEFRDT